MIEKDSKRYNEHIADLFHHPKNYGKLPDEETSISYAYEGPCGDTMEFFLKINGDKIEKATFTTDGCGASFASACQTTILIEGKTINFAENLNADDIDKALKGLPDDHKHCAELAARTIHRAIMAYKQQEEIH